MAGHLSGPGILSVRSKIKRPDILDEDTYLRWYDDEHIPDLVQMSGVRSGWRYRDTDPDSDGYWVFYSLKDLALLQSDEFFRTKFTSNSLPGSGVAIDLADFDSRFYRLVQVYDPTGKGPGTHKAHPWHMSPVVVWGKGRADMVAGHTKTILAAAFDLVGNQTAEDLDRWYRDEVRKSWA